MAVVIYNAPRNEH